MSRPHRPILALILGAVSCLIGGKGAAATLLLDLREPRSDIVIHGALAGDHLGRGVARGRGIAVGDLNGDGAPDLVTASGFADAGGRRGAGTVQVHFGPLPSGLVLDLAVEEADLSILGAEEDDAFGSAVAVADWNGDGIGDLAIGASESLRDSRTRVPRGGIHVLFGPLGPGSRDLASDPADWVLHGRDQDDRVGRWIGSGDLNGDGQTDLIVGVPFADSVANARFHAGEVHVVFGPLVEGDVLDLSSQEPDVTIWGADGSPTVFTPGDSLGWKLAVGDLDGDGFDDLVVSATGAGGPANARLRAGEVLVFRGPMSTGLRIDLAIEDADMMLFGRRGTLDPISGHGDVLGASVAVGDVTGDGLADLVAGAILAGEAHGVIEAGAVYVLPGPLAAGAVHDTASDVVAARFIGEDEDDGFGTAVVVADVNGDGVGDLVMTARQADGAGNAREECGDVHLVLGPVPEGDHVVGVGTSEVVMFGPDVDDVLGGRLAAGELSGDHRDDIVLVAHSGDGPTNDRPAAGEVHVVFGEPGNRAPHCDAGPALVLPCADLSPCDGGWLVRLDGGGSLDRDGDLERHDWEVTCGGSTSTHSGRLVDACLPLACGTACDVELTVTDERGNFATCTTSVQLIDANPPSIDAPPDASAECGAVPPMPILNAEDDCSGTLPTVPSETLIPGRCPGNYDLLRAWTAVDDCGNEARAEQVLRVRDTRPPVLAASLEVVECLWPPSHRWSCFELADFEAIATDACPAGDPEVRLAGCSSDQPEDGLGDGHFAPDCRVSDDGLRVCVRSERQGRPVTGRRYVVTAVAIDTCGNESPPTPVGVVHVPRDRRDHAPCR